MSASRPVIEIRAASATDLESLATIGTESFSAAYGATTTAADMAIHLDANFTVAAMGTAMQDPSCCFLLATVDAEPAGFVKLRDADVPDVIPAVAVREIQLLYILPDFQRFGLGRRLVDAAVVFAQEHDAHGLWLSAWKDADWAIGFYTKSGFRQVGTQEFRVGETRYTDYLMWLPFD